MANEDKVLKVLLQIQSDISDLGKLKTGMEDLKKSVEDTSKAGFSLGDAFKFAGAQEALEGLLDIIKEVGEQMLKVVEASVEKAAEIQSEEFPLTKMLQDSGAIAEEVLGRVNSLWQQFGVVSNEALGQAARNLLIMGTPAENLALRLTELTKISIGVGVSLQDMVSAYQRLRQAIENETEPMTRGMSGFGAATNAMVQLLGQSLGKTRDEVLSMFKAGTISLQDLLEAFKSATTEGGKFADVITEKKATFNGAVDAMKTAYQGLEVELGKPIIDVLTPMINKVTDLTRALAQIAADKGWQTALTVAWRIVIDEMATILIQVLGQAFTDLAPAVGKAFVVGFLQELKYELTAGVIRDLFSGNFGAAAWGTFGGVFAKSFTESFGVTMLGNLNIDLEKAKAMLEEALKKVSGDTAAATDEQVESLNHVQKKVNEVAVAVRDFETVLQGIRQTQQLINQNPLVGVDEKQRELILSYTLELGTLRAEIEKLTALKAGPLDPEQLATVNQKLQQANFEVLLLGEKLTGLTQPLQASLAQWVNSFGTVAQQIGKTIEGTINASLQATNTLITDAIFRTGNWRQTLQGVEKQIITLFLTFIEQLAIQRAAALLGITTVTSAKVASGVAIAASNAPAAAASSIATDGVSAVTGEASALAAIAAIEGALIAHSGGLMRRRMHIGGLARLAPDEVPVIAQEGEIMIRREMAQPFRNFLLALNEGHPRAMAAAGRQGDYPPGELWGDPVPPWEEPDILPGNVPSNLPGPGPTVITPTDPGGGEPSVPDIPTDYYGNPDYGDRLPFFLSPGYLPPGGAPPAFGPTMIPTDWVNDPDFGWVPRGVPVDTPTEAPMTDPVDVQHTGGVISRYHSGGFVSTPNIGRAIRRGVVSGLSGVSGVRSLGRVTGRGINIYAFTDMKEVIKHMSSREGEKIIFDTIKGRRIDLGL